MRLLSCSSFSSPKLLNGSGGTNGYHEEANQRLFVWSSADKGGIQRLLKAYQNWYKTLPQSGHTLSDQKLLGNLAHTLNNHRSHLPWRSYATLSSLADIEGLEQKLSDPVKASSTPLRLGFVFTGQGAQWFAMGRELLSFPTFKDELEAASVYIGNLGCQWSVIGMATSLIALKNV